MQLTIEKKVETTKEYLEVPDGFYNFGNVFFKVLGNKCLWVEGEDENGEGCVRRLNPKVSSNLIALALRGKMISEEEFNAVYCAGHNEEAAIVQPKLLKTA